MHCYKNNKPTVLITMDACPAAYINTDVATVMS